MANKNTKVDRAAIRNYTIRSLPPKGNRSNGAFVAVQANIVEQWASDRRLALAEHYKIHGKPKPWRF